MFSVDVRRTPQACVFALHGELDGIDDDQAALVLTATAPATAPGAATGAAPATATEAPGP
ncbi:hypothetical protein [Streptomyces sp. NPDC051577]|uniref:hypothetical protein n=1 Tax=Streptomyces sp. NPDC051577 TaxID=3155166 RepID=UPI003419FD2C